MDKIAYYGIMAGDCPIGQRDIEQGWHFCWEYDGLLVGPGCPELMECECLPKDHQAYLCIPSRPQFIPCPIEFDNHLNPR